MIELNKETKRDLGEAIQGFYEDVFEFNKIAGRELLMDQYGNQLNTVVEESLELSTGLAERNIVELVDAIADCMYTASFAVGILDGSDAITLDAPVYLNEQEIPLELLIPQALLELEEGNMIDFLSSCEDMCVVVNADMKYNLSQVSKSNLSKFPLVQEVPCPKAVCDEIMEEGRYSEVTYSVSKKFGENCYVFKAQKDNSNGKLYPQGKVVKPSEKYGYFEPTIAVYE